MVRSERDRGAILIHVVFALMALILFSAFVADYGVFWVARRQAQNSADAGALAGAIARAYDDTTDPPSTTSGIVYDAVINAATNNNIWGAAPPANTVNLAFSPCPDGTTKCVVVDVYRDGTNNSAPLPTFFMRFAGVNTQGTRAHAVAQAFAANHFGGCIRPWFVIDQYVDANGDGQYDAGDTYTAPGYQLPRDIGEVVTFHNNLSPSGYGQLDVGQGGAGIKDAIEQCASPDLSFTIGTSFPTKPGGTVGPEKQGVNQLVTWDPNAVWDSTNKKVINSCAQTSTGCLCPGNPGAVCPNGKFISPRVIIAPTCSPLESDCATGGPNNGSVTVTNLLAYFITGPASGNGNDVLIPAVLLAEAGDLLTGAPEPEGSFLRVITLIR